MTKKIDSVFKNNVLNTIKRQLISLSKIEKKVILNTIGIEKALIDSLDESQMVSKYISEASIYLDNLDMNKPKESKLLKKANLYLSGENKEDFKNKVKNYE